MLIYCRFSNFSAQREFQRCIQRIQEYKCSLGRLEELKNEATNEILMKDSYKLCKQNEGNFFCEEDKPEVDDAEISNLKPTSFMGKMFDYSGYWFTFLLVSVLVFCIVKAVKRCTQERGATPEPEYEEVETYV